jgi:hypothetical protein
LIEVIGERKSEVKNEPKGKQIAQLAQKALDEGGFEEGVTNSMAQGHQELLKEAVEKGKEEFKGDFFIHFEVKKERATFNLIHLHPFCFKKCPTPLPGQITYRYIHNENRVELLWQLLPIRICKYLEDNYFSLNDGQKFLYKEYQKLKDGTLLKLAQQLNGE